MTPHATDRAERASVLVVEDEEAIQRGICDVLAYQGHEPTGAASGEEGLREALSGRYDLVILDVMLPGMNGYDVCEAVRAERPEQPILMLTARGSEQDILEGFERGADDYVTKPFSVSELMARVKAMLRRSGRLRAERDEGFPFGAWKIDPAGLRAERGDESVDLSAREVAILDLFVRERGRIVSRRRLLREIWGFPHPEKIETRTVDMQIGKLRRKLDDPQAPSIETVRGAGYRYSGNG
jgi:two-component system response regulator RegX3